MIWNHGILNDFPPNSWEWKNMEKSSQLKNSMIFQDGGSTTNYPLVN